MSQDIVQATKSGRWPISGLGRYIVDAVVLEGRSPTQIARDHGISERWVFELLRRFREGGYSALEPRSRRSKSCPRQIDADIQELRRELVDAGHDAGPQTLGDCAVTQPGHQDSEIADACERERSGGVNDRMSSS